VAALVASACRAAGIAPTTSPGLPVGATSAPAEQSAAVVGQLRLTITESAYGSVAALTVPGASCSVDVAAATVQFGEPPPATLTAQVAPASGIVRWTYSAPRAPSSNGLHWVTCRSGADSAQVSKGFAVVERPPIVASGLSIHVIAGDPPRTVERTDPSLVPLRDAALAKMKATLATEWKRATRALGSAQLVDESADIAIYLVPARGTSVHRKGGDGSQDIVIYVSDPQFGPETTENLVATALHELGHIWCCYGPEAASDGHWLQLIRDPGLFGVDKYGLMNHPVTCEIFGTVVSCPNRFSDREMRALGFATFPAPAADPCVTQGLALTAQVTSVEAELQALKVQLDVDRTKLGQLQSQIHSLEAQYPNGMPPAQYTQYQSLIAQYNQLLRDSNARIDAYNGLADRDRALVAQMNALLCDWS